MNESRGLTAGLPGVQHDDVAPPLRQPRSISPAAPILCTLSPDVAASPVYPVVGGAAFHGASPLQDRESDQLRKSGDPAKRARVNGLLESDEAAWCAAVRLELCRGVTAEVWECAIRLPIVGGCPG